MFHVNTNSNVEILFQVKLWIHTKDIFLWLSTVCVCGYDYYKILFCVPQLANLVLHISTHAFIFVTLVYIHLCNLKKAYSTKYHSRINEALFDGNAKDT